jgi:hypothetical protein
VSMAKRVKSLPQERGTVLFDVVFEDGSRASNRRVPMEILGGLDGDQLARDLIEQQEAEIAQKAGRPSRDPEPDASRQAGAEACTGIGGRLERSIRDVRVALVRRGRAINLSTAASRRNLLTREP